MNWPVVCGKVIIPAHSEWKTSCASRENTGGSLAASGQFRKGENLSDHRHPENAAGFFPGYFLAFGAFLIPFVARKIIQPLRVIEKTTLRIAEGNFNALRSSHTG